MAKFTISKLHKVLHRQISRPIHYAILYSHSDDVSAYDLNIPTFAKHIPATNVGKTPFTC